MVDISAYSQRIKNAEAAGDFAAAERIKNEALAAIRKPAPAPKPGYRLTPKETAFPALADLTEADYRAMCADLVRLQRELRAAKGALHRQHVGA
jgi:diadenosine tetraphosphate (Ap4A) HIT family hydrolase